MHCQKIDYIIFSYSLLKTRSNGARALYNLATALEERGYKVFMCSSKPWASGYKYVDVEHITEEMRQKTVMVYPEGLKGNPLQFRNVVRYVLYYPGKFGGDVTFHAGDSIFTWAPKFYPDAPVLFIPYLNRALFYDNGSPKRQDCYFVHKGGKFREVKEIEGLLEINMKFPATREELAEVLRTTGILYTFDAESAIITEAHACGAQVKIITADSIVDAVEFDMFDEAEFRRQLDYFIQQTQTLDYQGALQPVEIPLRQKLKFLFYLAVNNRKKIAHYQRRYGFYPKRLPSKNSLKSPPTVV